MELKENCIVDGRYCSKIPSGLMGNEKKLLEGLKTLPKRGEKIAGITVMSTDTICPTELQVGLANGGVGYKDVKGFRYFRYQRMKVQYGADGKISAFEQC